MSAKRHGGPKLAFGITMQARRNTIIPEVDGTEPKVQSRGDESLASCSVRRASTGRTHQGLHMNEPAALDGTDGQVLKKCPTGIQGLDEITDGGLPRDRPTLVCGGPRAAARPCFGMEFLVRGATEYDEPGVFMAFEETAEELRRERPLARLRPGRAGRAEQARGRLRAHRAERDRGDRRVRPGGAVHPPGLRHRLVGAKRVVLDTLGGPLRRPVQRRPSSGPSSAACSAGSRTRGSRRSSPASGATAR